MAGIWTQAGVGGFGSGYPPRILKRTESIVQSAVFTAALSNNPSTTNPHIKQNAQPLVGLHAATERRRDLEVCRSRHDIFKPPVKKLASTLTSRKESVPLEDGIEDLA